MVTGKQLVVDVRTGKTETVDFEYEPVPYIPTKGIDPEKLKAELAKLGITADKIEGE